MTVTPDFKPPPRIRDRLARARKLHRDPLCRRCGTTRATQAHHIVFSSGRGDDVEDNLLPLCTDCHVLLHGKGPCFIQLTHAEIQYVYTKLGTSAGLAYLERRYLLVPSR